MIASKNSLLATFTKMKVDLGSIPTDNEKWVEAFNSLGIEVEEIISNHLNENDFCVVEIKELADHKDSDHLHVCKVFDGKDYHQIICGAQNLYVGMYTIMAKVGTTMPNGMEIKVREIRGVTSNGMLCSVNELFPAIKPYLTPIDLQGIVDLSKQGNDNVDFKLEHAAKNWIEYLMLDDDIFDLSIATNSGYMNGLVPIAISLLAYWNIEYTLELNKIVDKEIDNAKLVDEIGLIKFSQQNDNGSYKLRMILARNFLSAERLAEQKALLYSHYFSFPVIAISKKTDINNITVAETQQDIEVWTSFDVKYELPKGTTIIRQNNKMVCLPGIFSTKEFAPEFNDCSFYLLYSSTDWSKITKLSLKLSMSFYNAKLGSKLTSFYFINNYLKYFFKYLQSQDFYVANHVVKSSTFIKCSKENLFNKLTNNQDYLDKNKILNQLKLLGLVYDEQKEGFEIPPYRIDLENDNDLIEEALKFVNVNKLVPEPILSYIETNQDTKTFDLINEVKKYLISLGLYEVNTYKLTSETQFNNDLNSLLKNTEKQVITNPISKEKEVLKHSSLSSLYEVIQYNLNQKNYEMHNIFEVSKLYWEQNNEEDNILSAMLMIDIAITNKFKLEGNINLNLVFDLIRNISSLILKNSIQISFKKEQDHNYLEFYSININDDLVGFVGILNRTFDNNFISNNMPVYYFELNIDKLVSHSKDEISNKYETISKFPAITRDLNIEIPEDKDYSYLFIDTKDQLNRQIPDFVELSIKDVFINDGKKIITLNYIIHPKSNLSKDEINKIDENIKQIINKEIN